MRRKTPPWPGELTLTLIGDLMLGGDFSKDYTELTPTAIPAHARPWFIADVVLANLECSCSNRGTPTPNKILVYCRPEALGLLDEIRVDAVNLANNHIFDYGIGALDDTRAALERKGIGWFGAGERLTDASTPWFKDSAAGLVAVLGFSWTREWVQPAPAATPDRPGVNPLDLDHIGRSIERVRREHAPRAVVVSLHWGEGKSRYPRPDAVRQARLIIDSGANVVMGHHPHCLQPMERYKDGVILYSLGNFLASAYHKTPDRRLTYEGGVPRTRNLRERLTAAVRVTLDERNRPLVRYLPLVQHRDRPVLTSPNHREAAIIRRVLEQRSRVVADRTYPWRYGALRRWDEVASKLEDVREEGLRELSWKTPFRMTRKLVTGRNMH